MNLSTDYSSRPGPSRKVKSEAAIEAVYSLVLKNRRLTLQYIEETLEISCGSANTSTSDNLGMSKHEQARCMPRMFTADMKKFRREFQQLLQRYQEDFLAKIVTEDETRVHHFDPLSKQQSRQWKSAGSPAPKT